MICCTSRQNTAHYGGKDPEIAHKLSAQVRVSIVTGGWEWLLDLPNSWRGVLAQGLACWTQQSRSLEQIRIRINATYKVYSTWQAPFARMFKYSDSPPNTIPLFALPGSKDPFELPSWGREPNYRYWSTVISWDATNKNILVANEGIFKIIHEPSAW